MRRFGNKGSAEVGFGLIPVTDVMGDNGAGVMDNPSVRVGFGVQVQRGAVGGDRAGVVASVAKHIAKS